MTRILAISGSLRAISSNKALLRAAASLVDTDAEVVLYEGLASLPHFNPDLDTDSPPQTVLDFREQLRRADGVLFCTPEYAHGMPGVLKNALDWVVGSGEFMQMPVAIVNAAPRSTHAQASLAEVLTTMTASIVVASVPLSVTKTTFGPNGEIQDRDLASSFQAALRRFTLAIQQQPIRAL